ncbi:MAG: c-type cytochrome [Planctomycetes bacterium]|nr:c-type cytochrome [Planctomycetota bacterium]
MNDTALMLFIVAGAQANGDAELARRGCTNCHVSSHIASEPAPRLDRVGARLAPEFLRAYLASPSSAKPGTTMPDVLGALAGAERERAVDDLVHYLATLGGPFATSGLDVDASELERGRQLYHSVGCVACHGPQEPVDDLTSPLWDLELESAIAPHVATSFADPATTTNVAELASFLREPFTAHPAGRMPSLALDEGEARAIAVYLSRSAIAASGVIEEPGWRYDYFEGPIEAATRGFGGATWVRDGAVTNLEELPEHRDEHFGFQFSGLLEVVDAGLHRFALRSDDGSRLWLDGKLVIDNDGQHAPETKSAELWLSKGRHDLCVAYWENEGGEEFSLKWKTPTGGDEAIPATRARHWRIGIGPGATASFALDFAKSARGRELYRKFACNACHDTPIVGARPKTAKGLAELASATTRGCLADEPTNDVPRYSLAAADRETLRVALAQRATNATPREELAATLTDLNCIACHRRDDHGGPNETNAGYFKALVDADLGNEGRNPPSLDRAGAKLYTPWIERVLAGRGVERPYLATRMPIFAKEQIARLPQLFEAVDAPRDVATEAPFDEASVELGRKLAGEKGLSCIQCHSFNGTRSLGIPAVDLGHVADRIRPAWFKELLLDPKSVGMSSRMSTFWTENAGKLESPVKDVLDGDPKRQIDALWQYVSLGRSMPLPDGIVAPANEFELVVRDEPVLCGVFFAEASPRTLAVGFPERTHIAFDVENSRLVAAWRGHFFDAEGTWLGRAGGLEHPQGDDAIEFTRRAPFALLAKASDPWPTTLGRDAGYRRLGWRFDAKRRPIFRYAFGDVEIEELDYPLLAPGAAKLRRRFEVHAPRRVDGLCFLADAGAAQELSVRLVEGVGELTTFAGAAGTERRLNVPLVAAGSAFTASFEVEVSW